jgi:hypothetical protein
MIRSGEVSISMPVCLKHNAIDQTTMHNLHENRYHTQKFSLCEGLATF